MPSIRVKTNAIVVCVIPNTYWLEHCIKTKQPLQYAFFQKDLLEKCSGYRVYFPAMKIKSEDDVYNATLTGFFQTAEILAGCEVQPFLIVKDDERGTFIRCDSNFNKVFE